MKSIKKVALIILTLMTVLIFTACASGVQAEKLVIPDPEKETSEEIKYTNQNDVEDNLDGLCEYLVGNFAITGEDTKVEMAYEEIGAKAGYRYRFVYNSKNITVELYEFDLDNLNEKGKDCIDGIKTTGKFKMLDKEIDAILSENGKYMMVYTDEAKDEANVELRKNTEALFKGFKA